MKPVWLSDGGLTSNFPIHFFDALLPERPTFGVSLQSTLAEKAPDSERVILPENNNQGWTPPYVDIQGRDGLPSPLTCARYHSLVVAEETLPADLLVTARTASGIVMGVRHRSHPVEGVQMHPESILTARGHDMLTNFLARS